VTGIDWVVLGLVAVVAILGAQQGLVAGLLSLAGLVTGAVLGARLAPTFLSSGSRSPYAPLLSLGVALGLALLVQGLGLRLGLFLRDSVLRPSPLRALDTGGGLLLGAASGLVIAWVLGIVALQVPGQTGLRREVQRSVVLRKLNRIVPPGNVLRLLARIDPFPAIAGPLARVPPPDPAVLRLPGVRKAAPSVVRVVGTACGLGVEGSGWVAAPGLVVTAAHVVAGERDTRVELRGSGKRLIARAVAFDPRNDVAVLRVSGLSARPLRLVDAKPGAAVAILGYPEDGPFTATSARVGITTFVLMQDAYGGGPVGRIVTTIRGEVRHGDSGGPAVDAAGAVETTVFAARVGSANGFGVPSSAARRALAGAHGTVSTGPCAR
jgi:S1-C subfamily serine protease